MAKAKGRANGEGSIFEYPKGSGRWHAEITLPNGSAKRIRASSQREAREKLRQLLTDLERGVDLGKRQPTVAEWCETWLAEFSPNLKENVRFDYRGVVRRYISEVPLGRRRLDKLTPADVQAWVNDLADELSPQTVRNAHARLHKALAVAVKQGYLARNVAETTELPSVRTPPPNVWNFDQARAFLAHLEGHRLYALFRLALNLGMRQAELLGLTWDEIAFDQGTLRVWRQLRRVPAPGRSEGKAFVLQTTKTKAGERTLQLDDDLVDVLRAHRKNQLEERLLLGPEWKDTMGLVFVTETGAPFHGTEAVQHFKRVIKKVALPQIRFHDLRHTAATLMLMRGVPLVTVSKILGHSTPAITATIYAHTLDDAKSTAIAGLSKDLRRA